MNELNIFHKPPIHSAIEAKCKEVAFSMPSDLLVGTLLKTLITSRPKSYLLELGTGIGLSLSWMVDGMDETSRLISVDNDPDLTEIATHFFGADKRLEIICADGNDWISHYQGEKFDLIFADAWPGKYSKTEETLDLVKAGGFYVIDDMLAQPNWPEGHQENVDRLIGYLGSRNDFSMTQMNWSTGIIIMAKKV